MIEKPTKDLSIAIPLLNEEESIPELCSWIERVVVPLNYDYEILMIDDGSTDNSWDQIISLTKANPSIKGIRFNRNYGKSAALDIGFRNARGRVVITMDADLQDSPDEIPELFDMIDKQGYDLVSGWKQKRHDPLSKTIPSKFFNFITSWFSGIKLHDFNCGLKSYNYRVIKSIEVYGEMHRYIPFIAKGQGFDKITEKVVEHRARKYGVTKFGWERFVNGFLDLLSISFVSKFRKRPMHFFGSLGSLSFFAGSAITIYLVAEKVYLLSQNQPVRDVVDQPLFFIALVAILAGVQLFLGGFLAEMMVRQRSRESDYLISEQIGI
ncbi:MAG: glycosyltransferase family 2 protein [Bacteroidota bacterium]